MTKNLVAHLTILEVLAPPKVIEIYQSARGFKIQSSNDKKFIAKLGALRSETDTAEDIDLDSASVLKLLRELLNLRSQCVTYSYFNPSFFQPIDVLALITFDGFRTDNVEQLLDVICAQLGLHLDEAPISEIEHDGVIVERAAQIMFGKYSTFRVFGFKKSSSKTVVPLLYDLEEQNIFSSETIVHRSWYHDGGGAPISWAGGAELSRLHKTLLYERKWGDSETGDRIIVTRSSDQTVESVCNFVLDQNIWLDAWVTLCSPNLAQILKNRVSAKVLDWLDNSFGEEEYLVVNLEPKMKTKLVRRLTETHKDFKILVGSLNSANEYARGLLASFVEKLFNGQETQEYGSLEN